MTAEFLAAIVGVLLSLLFSYVPGFGAWFGSRNEDMRRLIMLGFLALIALGAFGLSCVGLAAEFGINITCDQAGAIGLLKAFFAAAIANQTAYQLTPKSKSRAAGRG